jgi:hypothetical protein
MLNSIAVSISSHGDLMPTTTISNRPTLRAEERDSVSSPEQTTGVLSDLAHFFFRKPRVRTLVRTDSEAARAEYTRRILQRLPIDVADYSILNIHQIGIAAPVTLVFEEFLQWDGESPCWPNHVATVESIDGSRESIRILAFGQWTRRIRQSGSWLGSNFGILFRLTGLRRQSCPDPANFDNARYLLYRCSGGYPIGVFCIYVRSPLESLGETEQAQVFFAVSFNFFGRQPNWLTRVITQVWGRVHNRVTSNVLNRFQQLCEADFDAFKNPVE